MKCCGIMTSFVHKLSDSPDLAPPGVSELILLNAVHKGNVVISFLKWYSEDCYIYIFS
jgi:hypothetical protein